jgi:predicted metalloprotease with PDZ domain
MIFGTAPFEKWLTPALDYVGCQLQKLPSALLHESRYGFRLAPTPAMTVGYVAPDSPAGKVLSVEDEFIALNGRKLENLNFQALLAQEEKAEITLFRQKKLMTVTLLADGQIHLPQYKISRKPKATPEQKENFKAWLKQDF